MVGGGWEVGILGNRTASGKAGCKERVERRGPSSATTLNRQLRELERDGRVNRNQYNEIPPRVEYAATEMAATLGPVLATIAEWVQTHAPQRSTMTETARNESGQPV